MLMCLPFEQLRNTQRREGLVKVVYSGCLSSKHTSGGLYIHDSEHPHLCTDNSVDVELAKGGGWIYPEGEGTGKQGIS